MDVEIELIDVGVGEDIYRMKMLVEWFFFNKKAKLTFDRGGRIVLFRRFGCIFG